MVRRPHALAAGCAALAALLWALAVFAHPVARLDAAALIGFTGLDGDRLHPFAQAVASFGDPGRHGGAYPPAPARAAGAAGGPLCG